MRYTRASEGKRSRQLSSVMSNCEKGTGWQCIMIKEKKGKKPDGFLFMFSEIFSCRCRNSRTNHVVEKTLIHSKTFVIKATVFFEVGEKKMKRPCCLLV